MEKTTMTDSTIAFIGLGLIGGSIARAIKKTRPDIRIMAYMRSRSRLEQAPGAQTKRFPASSDSRRGLRSPYSAGRVSSAIF